LNRTPRFLKRSTIRLPSQSMLEKLYLLVGEQEEYKNPKLAVCISDFGSMPEAYSKPRIFDFPISELDL